MDLKFDNINQAQLVLIDKVLTVGEAVIARGSRTLEIAPVSFTITNPRNRITTLIKRNWSFKSAIGELVWHLSGSNDLAFISSYLKQWSNFSENGKCITGSCYGYKIFKKGADKSSKWEDLIQLLKKDKFSRRAVLHLDNSEVSLSASAPDVSCTTSLQFLIRHGKLDLIVNMRSNDAIWGLPYDFFVFSFFQELLAKQLNFKLGNYHHFVGSFHIYERHFDLAKAIVENNSTRVNTIPMSEIPNVTDLPLFISTESIIRKGDFGPRELEILKIDNYWKELLKVLSTYKPATKKDQILLK